MSPQRGERLRILFCLPTTALSGGVKVVLEIGSRLAERGHSVEVFSYAGPPMWQDLVLPFVPARDVEGIDPTRYDFVFVSNAFLVPLLLPIVGERLVLYAQDYESFHHAVDPTFEAFMAENETFRELYRLPVPIITQSLAVQRLIRDLAGRDALYAPVGLRKDLFVERPRPRRGPARVLFVGNYLMPYKGMRDGFEALRLLSASRDVQLVLATQEDRNAALLDDLPFPKEVHLRPPESEMPDIYASADVYCCSSWYEGLGLPALEAFCCGVPVVSTRTIGVTDYGVDGVNLLLADPNDPVGLADALARVLDDESLAARLIEGGRATVRDRYDWETGVDRFEDALEVLHSQSRLPLDIEPAQLHALLLRLEEEGDLTPIKVFRQYESFAQEIDELCAAIVSGEARPALARLRDLRDALAPYVRNVRAEYHHAFRAKFDLCQLVLALEDRDDLSDLVRRLLAARKAHAPHAAPPFAEPRHRE